MAGLLNTDRMRQFSQTEHIDDCLDIRLVLVIGDICRGRVVHQCESATISLPLLHTFQSTPWQPSMLTAVSN